MLNMSDNTRVETEQTETIMYILAHTKGIDLNEQFVVVLHVFYCQNR